MGPTPTPGPPPGGLARALARATLPPVAVPSAYAGESRPVVRLPIVTAPVEGVVARSSPVPTVVSGMPNLATQPGAAAADAHRVDEASPSEVFQPPPLRGSVNDMPERQVLPSPGEPQPGLEPTPSQVPAAEETHAAALASPGPPDVGVASQHAVSGDDPGTVRTAVPETAPPVTEAEREPVAELASARAPDLPVQSQILEAAVVPRGHAPNPPAPSTDVTPAPEPVAPVVIGRIEVHVDSPAAQPDPFAGCRVVAAGLTARRGGGW